MAELAAAAVAPGGTGAQAAAPGMAACASAPELHFPPKYNVHGQVLPPGRGSGLGAPPAARQAASEPLPEEWKRVPAHPCKSVMLDNRRAGQLRELERTQSSLQIRSLEELRGSHQAKALLTGQFHAKETAATKARSKLLDQRRAANLSDLQAQAERFMSHEDRVRQQLSSAASTTAPELSLTCVPVHSNNPSSPITDTLAGAQERPSSTGPKPLRFAPDVKSEVIRHRPDPPSLNWVDEARTATEMHEQRRREHLLQLELAARRAEENAVVRVPRRRPRELGPLAHMESSDQNDFGRTTHPQIGAALRSQLLEARRVAHLAMMEEVKSASDRMELSRTRLITDPILQSKEPWWNMERSGGALAQIREKKAELAAAFHHKTYHVADSPAGSGVFKKEELARRRGRKQLPVKVSSRSRAELQGFDEARLVTSNHFTTTAIEFRNKDVTPALDKRGKKITYDPGENIPLFSSFTPDNIFLERKDRQRVELETQQREQQKKLGGKLPLRTFMVFRHGEDGAVGHVRHGGISGGGSTTLVGARAATSVGVRTGGFQNLDKSV